MALYDVGVTFALLIAHSRLACNSDGKNHHVALDVSISFPKAGKEGDVLTAEAKQISKTNKTGLYLIEVKNQNEELVALSMGTCYRTVKDLIVKSITNEQKQLII